MPKFNLICDDNDVSAHIETSLTGRDLLNESKLNKGCGFSLQEREAFKLNGLLPYQVETLEQQSARMYLQYQKQSTNLGKNIYLHVLHDYNETLFYKVVSEHLEEMLPIIYTPTVGEAVEHFSEEHRRPKGLYLSYPDRHLLEDMLDQLSPDLRIAVITDGEAVLGIGDQGIGGMHIANAKLMVYALCGGIHPFQITSIHLDVGTNNPKLLNDPMYLGWRHERVNGTEYQQFVADVISALTKRYPNMLFHWEDFSRNNARHILDTTQQQICSFNDDIQGTGVVALASIIAAAKVSGIPLPEHRIVIFGAGSAGLGIADQIFNAMIKMGVNEQDARKCFWLLDRSGLITNEKNLQPHQLRYAREASEVSQWQRLDPERIALYDVVKNMKPTVLIGCSTSAGAFSEEIVTMMAKETPRPIIMPLSNPNQLAEATPTQLYNWTDGKAIIATGSPFPDVNFKGKLYPVAQCNNALAYPGIGLGIIAVKAKQLSANMLWAATCALSEYSPALQNPEAPLLPKIAAAKQISAGIALAVARAAIEEGLANNTPADLSKHIERIMWTPAYYPYRKI